MKESVLAKYFKNEYPQTVAVVLSKIKADHASKALSLLPEKFAMEVIMQLLRMEVVQKDVLDIIVRMLQTELMTNLARMARTEPHEMMANIFNEIDRNTQNKSMSGLEVRNRESAEKIKSLMFTFDDLAKIDAVGVQVILRQVEKDQLVMALKGGSDDEGSYGIYGCCSSTRRRRSASVHLTSRQGTVRSWRNCPRHWRQR